MLGLPGSTEARILLVDDHPIIRKGVRNLLNSTPGFRIVGEAGCASRALELAMALDPDVALVDILMEGEDGIALARRLRRQAPRTKVIMLSAFGDALHVYQSLHAGARGYIVKSDEADEYTRTIRAVLAGAVSLSSSAEVVPPSGCGVRITAREGQVLALIAEGLVHEVIAIKLGMKKSTVRTHVENVLTKFALSIRDRDEFRAFVQSGRWLAYADWSEQEGPEEEPTDPGPGGPTAMRKP